VTYLIVWNTDADGDWGDPANWSPAQLPGPSDTVDIGTADFHTITYSAGTTTVETLTVGNDDFDLTGGTLTVTEGASFDNALTIDGGTLVLPYDSSVGGLLTNAGLVSVPHGSQLNLAGGTSTVRGFAIASGATLRFYEGAFTFSSTGTLGSSGSTIEVDNFCSVTTSAAMNIGGELYLSRLGTLDVAGHTTVFGPLDDDSGQVTGPGTLTLAGGIQVDGFVNMYGDGKVVLQSASTLDGTFYAYDGWAVENQGTLTLTGQPTYFDLSEGVQGATAGTLVNEAGATMKFGGTISEVVSFLPTTFTNAGVIENVNASETLIGGGLGSGITLVNKDAVVVQSGEFMLTGTMLGDGTVTVDSGATFTLDASATSVANKVDIASGSGMVSLTGGSGKDTVLFGANFAASDVVNGGGGNDRLMLDGDYSAGLTLGSATLQSVETIDLAGGNSYTITALDTLLAHGQTIRIDASALGAEDVFTFDGSAGTEGRFIITGGLGADDLTAGAQSVTFVYNSAAQSTGIDYDTINDFNFNSDRLDVSGSVNAIHISLDSSISAASFDGDMAAAVSGLLDAHTAVYVKAHGGTLNGETFLVIDQNGVAGYQSGSDLVIHLNAATGTLTAADFI
jgi:Peptidase M10 serralysin C terminal